MPNAHEPTDKLRLIVANMKSAGIQEKLIAKCIGVNNKTLTKYYSRELETAESFQIAKVAGLLYNKCLEGDIRAIIFYLKTRGRWRETDRPEDYINQDESVNKIEISLIDSDKVKEDE